MPKLTDAVIRDVIVRAKAMLGLTGKNEGYMAEGVQGFEELLESRALLRRLGKVSMHVEDNLGVVISSRQVCDHLAKWDGGTGEPGKDGTA